MKKQYPTKEELKRIEEWDWHDLEALAEFVCSLWEYDGCKFEDWKKDEIDREYRMLWLATSGWSGNEDIIRALNKNQMFNMICWQSSHRGGLHIYHIKKFENEPRNST